MSDEAVATSSLKSIPNTSASDQPIPMSMPAILRNPGYRPLQPVPPRQTRSGHVAANATLPPRQISKRRVRRSENSE